MANNSPTLVMASLSDDQLKKSIDSLVAHVDEAMKKMVQSTNNAVGEMEAKLKSLGNLKIDSGGSADGGASKRAKAQNAETDAVEKTIAARGKQIKKNQEVKMSYDQMQTALEKATRLPSEMRIPDMGKSARDSYIAFMQGYKQQAEQVRRLMEEEQKAMRQQRQGVVDGFTKTIEERKARIKELSEEIAKLYKERPDGYRDATKQRREEMNALKQKIRELSEAQKNLVDSPIGASNRYLELEKEYNRIKNIMIDTTNVQRQSTQETEKQTQSAKRYTEEIRNQAAATQRLVVVSEKEGKTLQEQKEHLALIRDIAREARRDISLFGRANITNYKGTVYAENDARAKGLTIEQQIEKIIAEENAARNAQLGTEKQITQEIEQRGKKYVAPSSYSTPMTSSLLRGFVGDKLGLTADKLVTSDASSPIKTVNAEMKQLQETYQKMTDAERTSPFGTQLRQRFQELQRQSQQLNAQLSRPVSLKDALKGSEKTLDDLAAKIRRLQSYMQGLDTSTEKSAQEFQRAAMHVALLKEKQNELLNKNSQLIRSNNELFKSNTALGRSWNYMKNRLAFYFTVGASTQFVKNLIEVRSQYEMNERALGILVNSAERGSQIFNELSQMALVSPYTLIELSAAAKQLTAYDVAAKDVVDTTRRLADMASAVGIPIERLTYALGQIKAYGYLNSRDARMFANAGIPLVKQLSDYYTELEGKLVSTADIYDRIKKKAIGYNDVMQVVNKMTDEGGKFFDFQAKMADTLKVQLANLTLAWNNLLNDIGEQTQGVLTFGIGALKSLFLAWKDVSNVLGSVAIAFGGYKAMQMLANVVIGKATRQTLKYVEANKLATWQEYHRALSIRGLTKDQARWLLLTNQSNKALVAAVMRMGVLDAATVRYIASLNGLKKGFAMLLLGGKMAIIGLGKALKSLGLALAANLPLLAIMGAVSIWQNLSENAEKIKKINEDIVNNAKESSKNIGEFLQRNIDLYKSLYEWGGESGKEIVGKKDIGRAEAAKAWDAIREEIETSSQASKIFVRELLDIGDINERVRKGFDYAKQIQAATSAMQELREEAVKVTSDVAWGIFGEGLKSDLQDFLEGLEGASIFDGSSASNPVFKGLEREFLSELHDTTNSIAAEIERLNLTPLGAQEAFARMADAIIKSEGMTAAQSEVFRIALEKDFTDVQRKMLEVKKLTALSPEERAAIQERIDAFDKAFGGTNKAALEAFFTWVRNGYAHLFDGMTEEDLKNINLQDEKYAELWRNYEKNFKRYHYAAYKELGDSVKEISTWSINIPVFFNVLDSSSKSVLDKWTKADKDLNDAKEKIDRLSRGIRQLKEGTKEYTAAQEELNSARKDEADARSRGGLDKEKKGGGSKKDVVLESLKQEIDLVKKLQGEYDKLTQKGASHADALSAVQSAYGKTLSLVNQRLRKMGLSELNLSIVTGKDPNMQLEHFKKTLEEMERKGLLTTERAKAVEAVIQELTVSAKTYNLDKLTKGLNSELDKLKDEYELALELDANPELGGMFMDMLGISMSNLPRTFGEALDRAQVIINRKLAEMDISTPFDLMKSDVNEFAKEAGLNVDSEVVKELAKAQNAWRDIFKKNITETEKILDDYVKKYGGYSDKIAEIEAARLEKLKRLNETYYKESTRNSPEYRAQLNAIERGAQREKQQVGFDEFKNSRYYTMMFENLDYVSTKTIRDMRDRIREYIETAKDLTPEQLKTLISQYEELEKKAVKRSPFKTLAKDLKEYFKTTKARKSANEEFRLAQKQYDAQEKSVAALKEQYEQAKANNYTSEARLDFLKIEIEAEDDILNYLKQQVEESQKKADKYNTNKKLALEEAAAVAQMVAANLASLGELRDNLQETFGFEFSEEINGVVDGLTKVGNSINDILSSAKEGNSVGVVSGVVSFAAGLGDAIASAFGDGSARTKRLNKEIEKSQESVRKLALAYKNLERATERAVGAQEIASRREQIANKEEQLAEMERQAALEKRKRSKDRDEDAIKEYEESMQDLRNEIEDLQREVTDTLLGGDVKSAAEDFVDTWVEAWRAGETTLDAINEKMDDMIMNLIKKAASSALVKPILDRLYSAVNKYSSEGSEGGVSITNTEMKMLADLSKQLGVEINEVLGAYYGLLEQMGTVGKSVGETELSALQQGIQSITEDTAGALEGITNGISQQCYLQSDLLTQIRDAVVGMDIDIQTTTQAQMLLQLQQSFQVQQSIQSILEGVLVPSGRAFAVELMS